MAKQQGVSEVLKAQDQMEWVRRMNNIFNAAREIVCNELIYTVYGISLATELENSAVRLIL